MEKLILILDRKSLVLLAAATSLVLSACSKKDDEALEGFDNYTVVSGQPSEKTDTRLAGDVTIRFLTTQPQPIGKLGLVMKGSLLASNSSVALIAFASTPRLTDGVRVRFSWLTDSSVAVDLQVGDVERKVNQGTLIGWEPDHLFLHLDVHNFENKVRVILWPMESVRTEIGSASFDTDISGHLSSALPATGATGIFSGIQLVNARLSKAAVQSHFLIEPAK